MMDQNPSYEYIEYICELYGDVYDDRIEDSSPPTAGYESREAGNDWKPGRVARHKSLAAFQKELSDKGIKLSSSKIKKVLVTGGCWSTKRSREICDLYNFLTAPISKGGMAIRGELAIKQIAEELQISVVTVSVNLPYQNVVYKLENRSSNAIRCARYKDRHKEKKGEL